MGFCGAQQYWAKDSQPYQFVPVTTFSEAFQKTKLGQSWDEALATPFQRPSGFPDELDPLQRSRYGQDHVLAVIVTPTHVMQDAVQSAALQNTTSNLLQWTAYAGPF